MVATGTLLLSDACSVPPSEQCRRERGLLEAAGRGELHLHVSSIAGDVLSLGAHHPRLAAEGERGCAGDGAGPRLWRRASGGRACAAGCGFLILTLALPQRSALGAAGGRLRPDQVMNRAVRGLLAALRRLGIDPTYPGLDAVTVGRRVLALLGFVELPAGPTLFQAVIAARESLARTPLLLDRLDPGGAVGSVLLCPADTITLAELGPAPAAELGGDTGGFAALLAAGYAEAFGLEVLELDPEVVGEIAADPPTHPDRATPPPGVRLASAMGLLGPVVAWARTASGTILDCGLGGDLIAPEGAIEALCDRLRGCPVAGAEIGGRIAAALDGDRAYVLGMRPAALCDLFVSAAAGG